MTSESTQKKCSRCGVYKPVEGFYKRPNGTHENVCRVCRSNRKRAHMSGSVDSYLRYLCANSKSANRNGRADWSITPEHVVGLWHRQGGRCALSGVIMTHHKDGSGTKDFNASIDRINPEIGYHDGNVQLVAYRVNIMKHTLREDELWWWVRNIVEKQSTSD
jgi:ribosomal protein S27AE